MTVNTIAECLRTDCNILGNKIKKRTTVTLKALMALNRICPQLLLSNTLALKSWLYNISKCCFHWFNDVMSSSPLCIGQTVLNNRWCSRLITSFNRVVLSTKWRTLRCAQQAWQRSMPLANEHLPNTRDSASWILHRSPTYHELSKLPRTPHTLHTFEC